MARPAAKASGTVAHETSARRQLSHSMNAKVIASERHEAMNCRMPCPSVSPADAVSLARRLMNSPWRVPSWRATGSRTTAAKSARRMSFTLPTESRTVATPLSACAAAPSAEAASPPRSSAARRPHGTAPPESTMTFVARPRIHGQTSPATVTTSCAGRSRATRRPRPRSRPSSRASVRIGASARCGVSCRSLWCGGGIAAHSPTTRPRPASPPRSLYGIPTFTRVNAKERTAESGRRMYRRASSIGR